MNKRDNDDVKSPEIYSKLETLLKDTEFPLENSHRNRTSLLYKSLQTYNVLRLAAFWETRRFCIKNAFSFETETTTFSPHYTLYERKQLFKNYTK